MKKLTQKSHKLLNTIGKAAINLGLAYSTFIFIGGWCIILFGEPEFPQE